jgi:hypothetical protein
MKNEPRVFTLDSIRELGVALLANVIWFFLMGRR